MIKIIIMMSIAKDQEFYEKGLPGNFPLVSLSLTRA